MNIVVAFQNAENAAQIRSILKKSGYAVVHAVSTGAQALAAADELASGLLICGAKFPDMTYRELRLDLPESFSMLLVASKAVALEREERDIFCLSMPLQVHELLETVEMLSYEVDRRRKKRRQTPKERSPEERKEIDEAKRLLMTRNGISEEEAHRYMQKTSMDNGTSLVETAQMILSLMR